jgi:hypothetical protein
VTSISHHHQQRRHDPVIIIIIVVVVGCVGRGYFCGMAKEESENDDSESQQLVRGGVVVGRTTNNGTDWVRIVGRGRTRTIPQYSNDDHPHQSLASGCIVAPIDDRTIRCR